MVQWRLVGLGIVMTALLFGIFALSGHIFLALSTGFPLGILVGYLPHRGISEGVFHGSLTAFGVLVLGIGTIVVTIWWGRQLSYTAPGFGYTLVFELFITGLLAAEILIGSAIGGTLDRLQ